ncbi:DNA polymerase beta superfamily protein [Chryseolinea soli]|uniref:Nucleotidyltransferase n=1 Tax=Chryseolinea soli TaxID=2321403 RepID=A0A385SJE0_9BACT|nr:nucleotidyltransferase domain-containing protein [Chryseolinea soli]AYB30407.1 nucleotidyltransferase [Chryseolinea soli]
MTLQELQKDSSSILFKCISGSQAYGLALPHSDTDIKGVFVLPKEEFYGLTYTDQINNATNDEMYYEIWKFVDLLLKNNPNILELLNTPADCILYRHPSMDLIRPEFFLSRLCNQTFGQYAYAQIKKARGLNKKILNPLDKKRKTVLDFCYVVQGQGSVPASEWLSNMHYRQEECGLVSINHMRDIYALFGPSPTQPFRGICSSERSDEVSLSSVPEGLTPAATLYFNKDGYTVYCKEYKQYWEWVDQRNEARYENTVEHGKNYDAKNMMHVFRLLNMAEEIARFNMVNVRRPDREWLLRIRAGEFAYDDLLQQADEKMQMVDELFKHSDLPETPDGELCEELLVKIRSEFTS